MTARWRAILRLRALLHGLLESFVPLGVLVQLVDRVAAHTDAELVTLYKLSQRGTVGGLSLELVQQLVDDEPFDTPDLLRVQNEITRRRDAAVSQGQGSLGADEAQARARELDELLAFMAPLVGAPLPRRAARE